MESTFAKSLILSVVFFILTPITLGTSLFTLAITEDNFKETKPVAIASNTVIPKPKYGARVYASLPAIPPTISGEVEAADARAEIVRRYLDRYNSPLEPYSNYIVSAADKHGLDFRLITAIAQQESNLCKVFPEGTYNCWGWGIHSRGTLGFSSFEEAIETVSAGLKSEYIDKGLVTPQEIMGKYTPLSNGSWAAGVETFMHEMQ